MNVITSAVTSLKNITVSGDFKQRNISVCCTSRQTSLLTAGLYVYVNYTTASSLWAIVKLLFNINGKGNNIVDDTLACSIQLNITAAATKTARHVID